MKAASVQTHLNPLNCQPQSLQLAAFRSRFASVLSIGIAVGALLMAAPAFGQNIPTAISKQTAYAEPARESVGPTLVKQTALFSPELDGMLAESLLWAVYLGLPLTVTMAIWRYDRHARQQLAKQVEQIATLERIWQNSQVH